jgi:hypothetical protein
MCFGFSEICGVVVLAVGRFLVDVEERFLVALNRRRKLEREKRELVKRQRRVDMEFPIVVECVGMKFWDEEEREKRHVLEWNGSHNSSLFSGSRRYRSTHTETFFEVAWLG